MRLVMRVGAVATAAQGVGLLALTVFFGVLFPRAGVSSPADFGDPSKYLPVVAVHPSWFAVPAWGLGLAADSLFLVALVAIRRRLGRASPVATDVAVLFAGLGMAIYLVGHALNVTWAPALIADFHRAGTLMPSTAAQYVVLARIYNGAMLGGSFFTGIGLVVLGVILVRTRIWSRGLGALAIAAGLVDAASIVALLPPALPLTGVTLAWLGGAMWRDREAE